MCPHEIDGDLFGLAVKNVTPFPAGHPWHTSSSIKAD